MFLDLVFLVLLILAVVKGYRRGLIVGIFSFIAIVIGLAAAIKLSAVVAGYIGEAVKISDRWLPVISFLVVFIGVVLLIRLGANLLQKTVEVAMMGWANRVGGIILYVIIYMMVYSIILFYADQLKLIKEETIANSVTYAFIQPWGPRVIGGFAAILPIFKNMFADLELFFDGIARNAS